MVCCVQKQYIFFCFKLYKTKSFLIFFCVTLDQIYGLYMYLYIYLLAQYWTICNTTMTMVDLRINTLNTYTHTLNPIYNTGNDGHQLSDTLKLYNINCVVLFREQHIFFYAFCKLMFAYCSIFPPRCYNIYIHPYIYIYIHVCNALFEYIVYYL